MSGGRVSVSSQTKRSSAVNARRAAKRESGVNKGSIHCPRFRLISVFFFVFLAFLGMGGRMVMIGLTPQGEPEPHVAAAPQEMPVRGNIYDRNGILLATSLQVMSLYADPKLVLDADEAATKLVKVLPFLNRKSVYNKLTHRGRFVWLARQLSPVQVKAVNDLGLPGLAFRTELARVYPQQDMAAHVVGAVDRDSKGIAGAERAFDEQLAQGQDIRLTIDGRLQSVLTRSLQEEMEKSQAKGASGVILDPHDGSILALASLPDFDPNTYGSADRESWRNTITHGVYEMGSTFKVFTLAQAMEEGKITSETAIDCTHPLRVGRFTIRDSHPKARVLTASEVLQYSSNIGASQIVEMIGEDKLKEFYNKMHFFESLDIGLMGMATPLFKQGRWGRVRTMTAGFGHGIAVSPLHVAAGVSAIVTDGYFRMPHLLYEPDAERHKGAKLVGAETSKAIRQMMRTVVVEGTGRKSLVQGFDIGGKTGTAEKAEGGGYARNKNLAAFVGVVPLENPRFVGLIMVDEAKLADGSAAGGGHVAAPVFGAFVKRAAPIVGLVPDQPSPSRVAKGEQSNELYRIVPATHRY